MFFNDVFICLFKFFFELGACIWVKAQFLCKILEIENAAYIITLSDRRFVARRFS